MQNSLTLVLGGASSGKTAYAEGLVMGSGLAPVYLATGQAFDDEMAAKIAAHKDSRGEGWRVVEEPLPSFETMLDIAPGEMLLFDCATLWISNLMLADLDWQDALPVLLDNLRNCAEPIVMVSNETGHGIVPDSAMGREFRDAQGKVNQALAVVADTVVFVTAGLPIALKGHLP